MTHVRGICAILSCSSSPFDLTSGPHMFQLDNPLQLQQPIVRLTAWIVYSQQTTNICVSKRRAAQCFIYPLVTATCRAWTRCSKRRATQCCTYPLVTATYRAWTRRCSSFRISFIALAYAVPKIVHPLKSAGAYCKRGGPSMTNLCVGASSLVMLEHRTPFKLSRSWMNQQRSHRNLLTFIREE